MASLNEGEHGLKFDIVDDKKSNRMTKVEGNYATINAKEFIWNTMYLNFILLQRRFDASCIIFKLQVRTIRITFTFS